MSSWTDGHRQQPILLCDVDHTLEGQQNRRENLPAGNQKERPGTKPILVLFCDVVM